MSCISTNQTELFIHNELPRGGGGGGGRKTKENIGACPKPVVNVNKNMLFDPQFGYLGLKYGLQFSLLNHLLLFLHISNLFVNLMESEKGLL